MARVFTKAGLTAELARARANGWDVHCAAAEKAERLPAGIMLAIASQETDMNDIVGDAGHGRGLFQIDDRFHIEFLRRNGAAGPGRTPPVPAAARHAAALVRSNLEFAARNGVGESDRLKFALSAYNAGPGGALAGFREGDSDRRTTGRDYGKAVLGRWAIFRELTGTAPKRPLKRGSRGKRVEELKAKLEAWFEKHVPGRFETFRIKPGKFYGVRVERAVEDFQRRVGIGIDGVAGDETFGALDQDRKPKRP